MYANIGFQLSEKDTIIQKYQMTEQEIRGALDDLGLTSGCEITDKGSSTTLLTTTLLRPLQTISITWGDSDLLLVRSTPKFKIPESSRKEVSKAIVLYNWNIRAGNFELNLESGELRHKISSFYSADQNVGPLTKYLVEHAIREFQDFIPRLQAVLK